MKINGVIVTELKTTDTTPHRTSNEQPMVMSRGQQVVSALSAEHKIFLASMTDAEFQRWFFEYIAFLATSIDPRSLTIPSLIVEVMDKSDGLPMKTMSRYCLASELYATSAYRRIFVESKEVAA